MIEPFRSDFNERFSEEKYQALVKRLNEEVGTEIQFRMAETPCFFSEALLQQLIDAGRELTMQLVGDPVYMARSRTAVPEAWNVPGIGAHPHFMTVDFGLARDAEGQLVPKLVELQAFPSIFGFQPIFGQAYKDIFGLDQRLQCTFGGLTGEAYWDKLREVIVAGHDPANVVLLEVDPENQKTYPDFHMHARHLGIRIVDIRSVEQHGNALFYHDPQQAGCLTPIRRIYNRAIVDEMVRREIEPPFRFRDALEVEWAGHPNWYFQISKFSLPFLHHPSVPAAVFLDDWYRGIGRERLPDDRAEWILKPLYSFAGKGIQFHPSQADLDAIPERERGNYLLQERVHFEPVIQTPVDPTQAEIRILYVWPDGGELTPMTNLVRMGRGMMMGVDHNRDRTWVGGTAGLYLPSTA